MTGHLPSARVALAAILLACVCVAAQAAVATTEPPLVPRPAHVELRPGAFALRDEHPLRVAPDDNATREIAALLAERVLRACGRKLRLDARGGGSILLKRSARGGDGRESYRLDVSRRRIVLEAGDDAGLRAGASTVLQLVCAPGTAKVPALRIDDAPRFAWRGVMLDSARHYQSPEFIHRFLEAMALHKLNVLHWHLTDDQGWRLEIHKYPRLTTVGAWRVPAGAARADIDPATGSPRLYGGFYDQATVRTIVAHAARLGITVVPEIDLPGHASAAMAAYPQLGAAPGIGAQVPADWGVYPNAFALDDAAFAMIEDILREVMAMFPSPWIHVGGDEVETAQWLHSASGRARLKEIGSDDPKALQAWFTARLGRFLAANDRRLVGWDEILSPGLATDAVVMSWRGVDGAITAAARGHDAVLTPWPALYLDNRQAAAADEPPGRIKVISLEDVYRFDPMPAAVPANARHRVLGVEAALWTEHVRTEARVGHMAFPRIAALAEVGWTPQDRRAWPDFARRAPLQFAHYAALDLAWADSAYAVRADSRYDAGFKRAQVTLRTQSGVGDIRYTLDGSEPGPDSPRYTAPFDVDAPADLRANAFDGTRPLARARAFRIDRDDELHHGSLDLKLCTENIALALEDDAPPTGDRAIFSVDIQNPCWILPGADLSGAHGLVARVGQVPFNFQIGELVKAIRFPAPQTPDGELEVHRDGCDGPLLARLPLAPAAASPATTTLPAVAFEPLSGSRDLCFRFAQHQVDPMWVLDSVDLVRP